MAVKVTTRTGKVKYLSQVLQSRKRKHDRRTEGIDWADWKPRHGAGVFANVSTAPYKHNGKERQL